MVLKKIVLLKDISIPKQKTHFEFARLLKVTPFVWNNDETIHSSLNVLIAYLIELKH
jgi:hypothetical protein